VKNLIPTRRYKFSTYAFWWIIRAEHEPGIAMPFRARFAAGPFLENGSVPCAGEPRESGQKAGCHARRSEIAEAQWRSRSRSLDSLLRSSLTTSSLDAPIPCDEGRSSLGDLIGPTGRQEPLELLERAMHLTTPSCLAIWSSRSARCWRCATASQWSRSAAPLARNRPTGCRFHRERVRARWSSRP